MGLWNQCCAPRDLRDVHVFIEMGRQFRPFLCEKCGLCWKSGGVPVLVLCIFVAESSRTCYCYAVLISLGFCIRGVGQDACHCCVCVATHFVVCVVVGCSASRGMVVAPITNTGSPCPMSNARARGTAAEPRFFARRIRP